MRSTLILCFSHKKMDQALLLKMFPEGSGNRRMESFSPAWYLLENHKHTKSVLFLINSLHIRNSTSVHIYMLYVRVHESRVYKRVHTLVEFLIYAYVYTHLCTLTYS